MSLFLKTAAAVFMGMFFMFPLSASADWSYGCNPWQWGNNVCHATTTTTGKLSVYVMVLGQQGVSAVPGDFSMVVNAPSANPRTFQGSQSGTVVELQGGDAYTVSLTPVIGYVPSYSVGCSGTIALRSQATCVVTVSRVSAYYGAPTPYPYSAQPVPLACTPAFQTVGIGQPVSFTTVGGMGAYNWSASGRSFLNIGSILNTIFTQSGTQLVTVTSGSQTATCTVNVQPSSGAVVMPGASSIPLVQQIFVPALPNTGFAPIGTLKFVSMLVVLFALGLSSYPYVRKTITFTLR